MSDSKQALSKTLTIEDIGWLAVGWWKLEDEWRRRSAAGGHSRDFAGRAFQALVDALNAYTAHQAQTVNDEEGD